MTNRRSDTPIGEARAYHPRGRTVRERRSSRTADPIRSALQVFDEPADRGGAATARKPAAARKPPAAGRKPPAVRKPAPAERKPAEQPPAGDRRPAKDRQPAAATTDRPSARPSRGARSRGPAGPARSTRATRSSRPSAPMRLRRWLWRRRPPKPPRPPKLASPAQRMRLATVLALALFAVLGVRLVELQLTDGPAYAASGLENRLQEVTLPASRGAIVDRAGSVLAHSVEARFVYADPELVVNPEAIAAQLQPLLGKPASELAELMRPSTLEDGTPSRFVWLARGVEVATADQIVAMNLPGIGVDRDERRIVPGNDLAANLIGFTGEDLAGLEGLEAAYDELLRGTDGQRTYESGRGDSEDREIPGGYRKETAPQPGSDLRLSVDMDLQYEAQRLLAEQLRAADGGFGAALVLDPRSGEVLAQASHPTYNAADPLDAPDADRVDAATATVFDPGSAHKPFVYGAALEEGVISPGDTLTVDPTIRKGDVTFQDSTWHPAGTELSLAAALAFSSNVATIQIADELGKEKLYEYQQAFGLGTPTGVGVPGEAAGDLLAPEEWYESSYGSVPIGHSVDVTALQMAAAYGAIANDGVWVQPQLVDAVIAPDGNEQGAEDPATRRVLSPENAAYLRELMEAVTTVPGGTGVTAAVEDYRVAGKTGTGKLVVDGEYASGEVASFVGMAPADNPQYVIAVVAHTPGGGGGEVAGPVFREMMGFTLNHYRVPPATSEPPEYDLYP